MEMMMLVSESFNWDTIELMQQQQQRELDAVMYCTNGVATSRVTKSSRYHPAA
jgi:hypothetical protein